MASGVSFDGDNSLRVPSIGFRGLRRLSVSGQAPAEGADGRLVTSYMPPAPAPLGYPSRDLLGSYLPPGTQLLTASSNAVDRMVPGSSANPHDPSARMAALVQSAAVPHQANGSGAVGCGWGPRPLVAGMDVSVLHSSGLMHSSGQAAADAGLVGDRRLGSQYLGSNEGSRGIAPYGSPQSIPAYGKVSRIPEREQQAQVSSESIGCNNMSR